MTIIEKYINIVKKEMTEYVVNIFEKDYDKDIFEEFFKKYIDVRYYNSNEKIKKKEYLRKIIITELEKQKRKIIKKYDREKVSNICDVFKYIMCFDNVGNYRKIDVIIDKIIEFRKEKLNQKDNKLFQREFIKLVREKNNLKEEYIKKFESKFFKLRNKKIVKKNIGLTTLKYDISFPKAFTTNTIEETYNSDITREDKLFVEYNMINIQVLKDIIKGDFYKQYIVEFTTTILSKRSKLTRVLKVIEDESVKERVNLLIEYEEFNDYTKNDIYNLMRQGYKIAVKLSEKDNLSEQEVACLDVFSYILINDKVPNYRDLIKTKRILKKIVKN